MLHKTPRADTGYTLQIISGLFSDLSAWHEGNSTLPRGDLLESEWLMGLMLLNRPCRLRPSRTSDELQESWHSALGFNQLHCNLVETDSLSFTSTLLAQRYTG